MNSKTKGLLWIGAIFIIAFYFSNGMSLLVRLIPHSVEQKIAEKINSFHRPNLCETGNAEAQKALDKMIARLYPIPALGDNDNIDVTKLNIRFIHNDQVNAFATLGGDIFVFSGLLRDVETPEELAGVVAHELAHVTERHVLKGVLSSLIMAGVAGIEGVQDNFFRIAFTKGEEHEADLLGLERLKAAQINVSGYVNFFSKKSGKSGPEWLSLLSDHPGNDSRKTLAQKYLNHPSRELLTTTEWKHLKNFCSE